jgi:hypothetical protein
MGKFASRHKIIAYDIPMPEITKQSRIARVFLDFSKPGHMVSLGGETWARQQVIHPITEYERKITFAKAKQILRKYER